MATSKDLRNVIDIIIPTYNNQQQLMQCIQSMILYNSEYPLRLIIVNNGDTPLGLDEGENLVVINTEKNLGWTGGLIEGLKVSKSKYVMFANDDIFIPRSSIQWLKRLAKTLDSYEGVGAVGPSSNVVSGIQNIFAPVAFSTASTAYLIGFCILLRRKALDKSGGIQHMENGGDDLDLSIRLRKAGYGLVVDKDIFVYHHGFQTGERVYGTPDKPKGWNSREMIENTNMELIRKHGFKEYHSTSIDSVYHNYTEYVQKEGKKKYDAEALIIHKYINGGKIVELGCGNRKTVDNAIGVDIIPYGEPIPYNANQISVADIVSDVTDPLPFDNNSVGTIIARHVLEHCLDVPKTLRQWTDVLTDNGRLIIACPNENLVEGIPLNADHLHAFTADSVKSHAATLNLKEIGRDEYMNGVSFVIAFQKERELCV